MIISTAATITLSSDRREVPVCEVEGIVGRMREHLAEAAKLLGMHLEWAVEIDNLTIRRTGTGRIYEADIILSASAELNIEPMDEEEGITSSDLWEAQARFESHFVDAPLTDLKAMLEAYGICQVDFVCKTELQDLTEEEDKIWRETA